MSSSQDVMETPQPDPQVRPSPGWMQRMEFKLNATSDTVIAIKEALVGTMERPGIIRRMERMEEDAKARKFWTTTVLTIAVGCLVTSICMFLASGWKWPQQPVTGHSAGKP